MPQEVSSTAVERALRILETIAERDEGFSNSEIHRQLGIPKSSVTYLLRALEQRHYVVRDPSTGRYRLGLQVLSLSRGVLRGLGIRELALPLLHRLAEKTHLTTHLAVLDRGKAVYIEKLDAAGFIKMNTWVGRRMDLHCTAVGKAIAAHLSKGEIEAIVREQGLPKRGPKCITSLTRLFADLKKVREQGYAVDDEENNPGARCVAAPIFDALDEVRASVGVSGTTSQVSEEHLPVILATVRETAHAISQRLGTESAVRRAV